MNDATPVSVIVPTYNAAPFISDAIECVLTQDYPADEIIVVDDGSTDMTAQVVAGFGGAVRYVHQENQGPAGARNVGLRLARGRLITFLDADDLWAPSTLRVLRDRMVCDPGAEIVLGLIQYMRRATKGSLFEPFGEPCFSLSLDAALFRREVFDKVGFFDTSRRSSEDIDWFLRARESGAALQVINDVVLFYRRHNDNLTRDRESSHRDLAHALKRSLDRRRGGGMSVSRGNLAG